MELYFQIESIFMVSLGSFIVGNLVFKGCSRSQCFTSPLLLLTRLYVPQIPFWKAGEAISPFEDIHNVSFPEIIFTPGVMSFMKLLQTTLCTVGARCISKPFCKHHFLRSHSTPMGEWVPLLPPFWLHKLRPTKDNLHVLGLQNT